MRVLLSSELVMQRADETYLIFHDRLLVDRFEKSEPGVLPLKSK